MALGHGLALLLCAAACAAAPPNLVLLVLDDIGWADVGFHGSDFPTPHIDKRVAEGVELQRMYVMPQCSPTRSAIMTGRHAWTLGMQHFTTLMPGSTASLPTDAPTLAEALRPLGYTTHAIGKWHLGNTEWANTPTGRGFDSYLGYLQGQTDYYNRTLGSCGLKQACLYRSNCDDFEHGVCVKPTASPYGPNAAAADWWNGQEAALAHLGNYTVDEYSAEFKRVVTGKAATQKPFFVYFAMQLLHIPIQVPPEARYLDACRGVTGGYPTNNRTQLCSMAARLDAAFVEIDSILADAGEWENTLIWVVTDNGGMTAWKDTWPASASSNYPLRGGKTTLYEGGVRAVSFLYGGWEGLPAGARGARRTELTHAVDIHPTLLHLASEGLAGDAFSGENIWGTITGAAPTERTELPLNIATNKDLTASGIPNPFVANASHANYTALISWPWKVVVGEAYMNLGVELQPRGGWWSVANYTYEAAPPVSKGGVQLFDLSADESEHRDVAAAHPDVVARLMDRVAYWLSEDAGYRHPQTNIPTPRGNPKYHHWTWAPRAL